MKKILVVGAGFAGAVYARILADHGYQVSVIDRRRHVAGNCFDYTHNCGIRIHSYGPHLFHTSNLRVVDWLSQFTEWVSYSHKVVARLSDSRLVPLPVNINTINSTFNINLQSPEEVSQYLSSISKKIKNIKNAEDWLYSNIGPQLTDLYFRPYTKKMWDLDLSDVSASVVQRIQIRTDADDRYFPSDTFQGLPLNGYTKLFENILSHSNIKIELGVEFKHDMLEKYDFCFNSMPIDMFFNLEYGELPYRSIKFHLNEFSSKEAPVHATINYTDTGPFTRETWWHNIPGHLINDTGIAIRTVEEPCDYKENNFERYYPVKTADGRYDKIREKYAIKASEIQNIKFIGRCGTYQYLDMHQVINQSMSGAQKWLDDLKN